MLHLADLSAENFFDDILVHSASWSDHLHHVRNVLHRLKSYGRFPVVEIFGSCCWE